MKRWALVTVALYVLCLSIFAVPLLLFIDSAYSTLLPFYYAWFVPILVLIQIALLLIPVEIAQQRPVKRRKIIATVILGAFPMVALTLAFLVSITFMIWGESGGPNELLLGWMFLPILLLLWLGWGVVFWRAASSKNPNDFISTVTRWLLRGSILGVLVAIPSHIISRNRDECCAPVLTLGGIVAGLAIALMSFGPGVFFLFAKRIADKRTGQRRAEPT